METDLRWWDALALRMMRQMIATVPKETTINVVNRVSHDIYGPDLKAIIITVQPGLMRE